MPKRDIVNKIIRSRTIPDRMGVCEDFWPETVQTTWPAKGLPESTNHTAHFDLDIVDLMEYWKGRRFVQQPFLTSERIEEDEETVVFKSGWGMTQRTWKHKSGTPEHLGFDLTTPEIWRKKYREPLLHLDTRRFPDLEDLKQRFKEHTDAGFFTMYNNTFVFEQMRYSMGDVRMLEACLLEQEWIHDFCSVFTDFAIMHVGYLFREVGVPDGYTIYDDMAYTKAPFMSPALYKELILPYLKRFVDFLKSYGCAVIMHSCGNVAPQMANIIEAGIDCIQPLEAKTDMDLVELGEEFGDRIAFMGNIDIRALETNDPTAIEREILPKLRVVREHRIPYIFHSDHSISPAVGVSSFRHALDVFRSNCRY